MCSKSPLSILNAVLTILLYIHMPIYQVNVKKYIKVSQVVLVLSNKLLLLYIVLPGNKQSLLDRL